MGDISTFSRQIYTVFVYFNKCPKTKFLCCTLKNLTKISSWIVKLSFLILFRIIMYIDFDIIHKDV